MEKAFRHLKGDASLFPVIYKLLGRVNGYLSVVDFLAYELMASIDCKIDFHNVKMRYKDLADKLSKIYRVLLVWKGSQIYRCITVS